MSQLRLFINELELMNRLMLFLTIHCRLEHLHFIIKNMHLLVLQREYQEEKLAFTAKGQETCCRDENEVRIRCRNKSVMRARCREGNETCCRNESADSYADRKDANKDAKRNPMHVLKQRHQSTDELHE